MCVCVCVCVCLKHPFTHIRMYVCECMHVFEKPIYTHTHTHTHKYIYIYIYIYMRKVRKLWLFYKDNLFRGYCLLKKLSPWQNMSF